MTEVILALGATVDGATTRALAAEPATPLGVAVDPGRPGRTDRRRARRARRRHPGRRVARAPAVSSRAAAHPSRRHGPAGWRPRTGRWRRWGCFRRRPPTPGRPSCRRECPESWSRCRDRGHGAAWELGRAGYDAACWRPARAPADETGPCARGTKSSRPTACSACAGTRASICTSTLGPPRIPSPRGHLAYCRELGVKLEVMSNDNRGAFLHDDAAFGGQTAAQRRRGERRARLCRGARRQGGRPGADRAPCFVEDRNDCARFLRAFGALDRDLVYRGSSRAGFALPPGTMAGGRLDSRSICASSCCRISGKARCSSASARTRPDDDAAGRRDGRDRQQLSAASSARGDYATTRRSWRFAATEAGARIVWKDATAARTQVIDAPLVVCTIPFPVLRASTAISRPKSARRSPPSTMFPPRRSRSRRERRFWEIDENNLRRHLLDQPPQPRKSGIRAPASTRSKGVYVGAYIWSDDIGNAFAAKPPAQRLEDTLADDEAVHPGCERTPAQGRERRLEEGAVHQRRLGRVEPGPRGRVYRRPSTRGRPLPVLRRAPVLSTAGKRARSVRRITPSPRISPSAPRPQNNPTGTGPAASRRDPARSASDRTEEPNARRDAKAGECQARCPELDEAHREAGDGTLQGSVPAGLTTEELKDRSKSPDPDSDAATG